MTAQGPDDVGTRAARNLVTGELRRANEILKDGISFFTQAELDHKLKR